MKLALCVLGQSENPHIEAFRETAEVVHAGLTWLAHDCPHAPLFRPTQADIDSAAERGFRLIVLGAVHAHALGLHLPSDAIVYNLEQSGSAWFTPAYTDLLKKHLVWDYNAWNTEQLQSRYRVKAQHVPLGDTVPSTLKRFERKPPAERDIDVLMFGYSQPHDRRDALALTLRTMGLRVAQIGLSQATYGDERNGCLARAKLVVSCHYYKPAAPFESARGALCLAHGLPLLSETSLAPDLWATEYHPVAFARYADLATSAKVLIDNPSILDAMSAEGIAQLRYHPVTGGLREALASL